jgi:curved DNA-binding protein
MGIEFKDYYAILGVKKTASPDEIKNSYRRLARLHHPDLHPEKQKAQAGEKFKEINEAYEVLSDPKKKSKYDQIGPGWDATQAPPPPRREARRAAPDAESFGGFSDFFESLFGGAGGPGASAETIFRTAPSQGQDIEAELSLSLEAAFQGGEKKFSLAVPALCPACAGSGRLGRGYCPACRGAGQVSRDRSITAHLPAHVRDGMRLRLRGQGGPAPRGGQPGDLFLRVRLLPHPLLKVSGSNLDTTVTLTPWDAALGCEAAAHSLEGPIRIKIPAGTHAGRRLRIAGKGLRKEDGSRGDLYAVARIDIPEFTDGRLTKLYEQMREAAR